MNVLIIGKNAVNEALKQEFEHRAIEVQVIDSVKDITRVKAHHSGFETIYGNETIYSSGIFITEPAEHMSVTDGSPLKFTEHEALLNTEGKLVFLLDYLGESPAHQTAKALEAALFLAGKKREVVFLSQFVKTALPGTEEMYRKARQAGVYFIKFETIALDYEAESGVYSLKLSDGMFDLKISTENLVCAELGSLEKRDYIIKKLRLNKANDSHISGNKYFLNPVLTSRRAMFYFNPDLWDKNLGASVKRLMPAIIAELNDLSTTNASVDAEKCAFCYSCYRACPHAALEPDMEKSAMKCVESACYACGVCIAICPGQAVSFADKPAEKDTKVHTCKAFLCENSAYPAAASLGYSSKLDIEKISCGGEIGQDSIAAALAKYDKVLAAVCMDSACRHFSGGERACAHIDKINETIGKMGLYKQIAVIKTSHAMKDKFAEELDAFLEVDKS